MSKYWEKIFKKKNNYNDLNSQNTIKHIFIAKLAWRFSWKEKKMMRALKSRPRRVDQLSTSDESIGEPSEAAVLGFSFQFAVIYFFPAIIRLPPPRPDRVPFDVKDIYSLIGKCGKGRFCSFKQPDLVALTAV